MLRSPKAATVRLLVLVPHPVLMLVAVLALEENDLQFGLDAIVPAPTYSGKKMASASEALQETRRALGINPP
jgi:hypothetical protein